MLIFNRSARKRISIASDRNTKNAKRTDDACLQRVKELRKGLLPVLLKALIFRPNRVIHGASLKRYKRNGKRNFIARKKIREKCFLSTRYSFFFFLFFFFRVLGVAVERLKRVELNKLRSFSSRLVENSVN